MNLSHIFTALTAAVISGVASSYVTYTIVKKSVEERAERDIQGIKEHYKLVRKENGDVTIFGEKEPEEKYAEAQEFVRTYEMLNDLGYSGTDDIESPSVPVLPPKQREVRTDYTKVSVAPETATEEPEEAFPAGNVFTGDYMPVEGEPHLISRMEFEEDYEGYDQDTVVYYEGDDTLCDALTGAPIEDIEAVIGRRHLDMFGKLSEDPEIVYVQNDRIETKYEVARNDGYYSVIVLGLDPEDVGAKSPKQRPRKMRDDD